MTTPFEEARVGDRVYHVWNGWGTIVRTASALEYQLPIDVNFDNGRYDTFTSDGTEFAWDDEQTLFYENPQDTNEDKEND